VPSSPGTPWSALKTTSGAASAMRERLRDPLARHQRHRPLVGPAAHQDGDVKFAIRHLQKSPFVLSLSKHRS
jgi:hypothetical protein